MADQSPVVVSNSGRKQVLQKENVLVHPNGVPFLLNDASWRYTYNSSTTVADPGTGKFLLNSGTLSAATIGAVSKTDLDSNDLTNWFYDTVDAIPTGVLVLRHGTDPTVWAVYYVSSPSNQTDYVRLSLQHIAHGAGSFVNGHPFRVIYDRAPQPVSRVSSLPADTKARLNLAIR